MGFFNWLSDVFGSAPVDTATYYGRSESSGRQPDSFLDGSMWQELSTPNIPSKDPTEGIMGDYYRQRSIGEAFSNFFNRSGSFERGRQQAGNEYSQGQRSWGGNGNSGNSHYSHSHQDKGTALKGKWHVILGCSSNAGAKEIQKAYHERAKAYHPDYGGSDDAFRAIHDAYEEGMRKRGGK